MGRVRDYPIDWYDIAARVKIVAGWKCEACGTPTGRSIDGAMLTVHHLDGDKMNPRKMPTEIPHENLIALCQRCHLRAEQWTKVGSFISRRHAIERLALIVVEERAQGDLFA